MLCLKLIHIFLLNALKITSARCNYFGNSTQTPLEQELEFVWIKFAAHRDCPEHGEQQNLLMGWKEGFWPGLGITFGRDLLCSSWAIAGLLLSFVVLGTSLGSGDKDCGHSCLVILPGHSCLVIPAWPFLPLVIPVPGHSYLCSFLALLLPAPAHCCCLPLTAGLHMPGFCYQRDSPWPWNCRNIHLSLLGLCLVKSTQSLSSPVNAPAAVTDLGIQLLIPELHSLSSHWNKPFNCLDGYSESGFVPVIIY